MSCCLNVSSEETVGYMDDFVISGISSPDFDRREAAFSEESYDNAMSSTSSRFVECAVPEAKSISENKKAESFACIFCDIDCVFYSVRCWSKVEEVKRIFAWNVVKRRNMSLEQRSCLPG